MSDRSWEGRADELAARAVADDRPTRWFDELWGEAAQDRIDTPWSRSDPMGPVVEAVAALGPGEGRRAVVVGAGLGADAEHLAREGWATTAFDVAPSAVDLVRRRYPDSAVDYRVADLLALPDDLVGAFDLVVEVFTVQALPRSLRAAAGRGVRALLAPGGSAVVVQFDRGPHRSPDAGPPWLLDEAEVRALADGDVRLVSLGSRPHPSTVTGPDMLVAVLRRDGAA